MFNSFMDICPQNDMFTATFNLVTHVSENRNVWNRNKKDRSSLIHSLLFHLQKPPTKRLQHN